MIISLTEARKLGAECRYQLDHGEDPRVEHKRREVEAIEKLHKLDTQKSQYLKTWQLSGLNINVQSTPGRTMRKGNARRTCDSGNTYIHSLGIGLFKSWVLKMQ